MDVASVVSTGQAFWNWFIAALPALVEAVPLILIPAGLMMSRQIIKFTKSLLFYSRGRKRG